MCKYYFFCLHTCSITINQNLLVLAMKLTNSTTIVTALSNLTPQSTFIVAVLTRSPNCSPSPIPFTDSQISFSP